MRLLKTVARSSVYKSVIRAALSLGGGYPIRRDAQFSPFFIIGSGRSGNTLLRRIIMGHENVYIPPETYVLGPCVNVFKRHSYLDWDSLSSIILSMFAFSEDFETFPTQSLFKLAQEVKLYPPKKRSLDNIINNFYMFMARQVKPNTVIWGDKTPINAFRLHDIDSVFPNARYIHMLRDGCDVISSYLEMGRYPNIRTAAKRWRNATTLCQNFGEKIPDRYLEIRYEDLVTRPYIIAREVCHFINIELDEDMIEKPPEISEFGDIAVRSHYTQVAGKISQDSLGKGRSRFSKKELMEIQSLVGDHLEKLGYKPAYD